MNPNDPFSQPQAGQQQQPAPQPSIQPQAPSDPIYDPAPGVPVQPQMQPQVQPQPGVAGQPNIYMTPPKPSKLWMILTIITGVLLLAALGAFVWAMLQYYDQRDNVDSRVTVAVAEAVKKQSEKDAADFQEKEKQPNRLFVAPDDYGRLSFNYPKTWSAYVDKDAQKGGSYAAYLNPVSVPPVGSATPQQYSLRVLIEEKDYDKVLDTYKERVKKGELKSSAVKADGQNGTRLDGQFTKDLRGSAVIFKIRDKTVTVQTDADTFRADFDALIQTITFNK